MTRSATCCPTRRRPRGLRSRSRADRRQPQGRARRRLLRRAGRQGRRARAIVARRRRARRRRRRRRAAAGARSATRVRRGRRRARGARARRRRASIPRQPATSSPSPAPAARPRSPPSCARSGRALGLEAASLGTIGIVSRRRTRLRLADDARSVTLHQTLDAAGAATASRIWRWRRPRTGSTRSGSTACASPPAAFTNLSRDHLDYHATLDDYLAAKLRLFRELLPPGAPAVIDADSDVAARVIAAAAQRAGRASFTVGARGRGRSGSSSAAATASRPASTLAHAGRDLRSAAAAAGRFPGLQRARRGGPLHRDRRRPGRGLRRARDARGRAGPARARRRTARRAGLRRLRPQARRARKGAGGAAALRRAAGSSWCSAAAATATPASGR